MAATPDGIPEALARGGPELGPHSGRSADVVGDQQIDPEGGGARLDRLSPLLHDLLAWDLVYRNESGEFVLRPDVQRRLVQTAAKAPRFAAEVYVGRHCDRCGVIGITRLIGGVRLCAPCAAYLQSPDTEPAAPAEAKRRRWVGRSRRYRDAG